MKGFTFYLTYFDVAQELSKKDRGAFYDAVANYMFLDQDDEETLSKRAKIAFKCIKPNLKRSKNQSENAQNTRSNATEKLAKNSETKSKASQIETSSISSSMSNSRPKSAQSTAPNFGKAYADGANEDAADEDWKLPSLAEFLEMIE